MIFFKLAEGNFSQFLGVCHYYAFRDPCMIIFGLIKELFLIPEVGFLPAEHITLKIKVWILICVSYSQFNFSPSPTPPPPFFLGETIAALTDVSSLNRPESDGQITIFTDKTGVIKAARLLLSLVTRVLLLADRVVIKQIIRSRNKVLTFLMFLLVSFRVV